MALSKLNNGGWVHIFPEGSRSRDGGKTISSAKRGVGRSGNTCDHLYTIFFLTHLINQTSYSHGLLVHLKAQNLSCKKKKVCYQTRHTLTAICKSWSTTSYDIVCIT